MIDLARTHAALRDAGLGAWVLWDFRGSNPVLWHVLGTPPLRHVLEVRDLALEHVRGRLGAVTERDVPDRVLVPGTGSRSSRASTSTTSACGSSATSTCTRSAVLS